MMKKHTCLIQLLLSGFLILCGIQAVAIDSPTTLTMDSAIRLARSNYPLLRQMDIIGLTEEYSLSNASKANIPQLNISGQYTTQSDVLSLPKEFSSIPPLSKEQYKVVAELSQSLTDFISVRNQKELIRSGSKAAQYSVETEFVKLREKMEQIYFGIILLDQQLQQNLILRGDLTAAITKVKAAIANGTAITRDEDMLKAEIIKLDQRETEMMTARKAYLNMLSLLINRKLNEDIHLQLPPEKPVLAEIRRPELNYFKEQANSLAIQNKLTTSGNIPRISLFAQAGYGQPGLNMLDRNPDFFYIGGIRMNWNISTLYTLGKGHKINSLNQKSVEVQRDIFILNTNMALEQQQSEIDKYTGLLKSDQEIIILRNRIKETAKVQLENGTITSNDFIQYLNASDQAVQSRLLHEVQLSLARYHYNTLTGN